MKVCFVRHGESKGNKEKIHSGWGSVPLTEKGVQQAAECGKVLSQMQFNRVFVSDLLRTQETALYALPGWKDRFEYTPLIREYANGWFCGSPFDDMETLFGEEYLAWRRGQDYSEVGGEDPNVFQNRIGEFMHMLEGLEDEARVAVFTHAGVMREIARYVLGVPYRSGLMPTDNCGICMLEYRGGIWRVLCWNYTPVISGLAARFE